MVENWFTHFVLGNKNSLGTDQEVQTGQFTDRSESLSRQNYEDNLSQDNINVNGWTSDSSEANSKNDFTEKCLIKNTTNEEGQQSNNNGGNNTPAFNEKLAENQQPTQPARGKDTVGKGGQKDNLNYRFAHTNNVSNRIS